MDISVLNSLTQAQRDQIAKVLSGGGTNNSPPTASSSQNTAPYQHSPSNVSRSLLRSPSSSSLNAAGPVGLPSPSNANLIGPRYPSNTLGSSPGHSPVINLINIGSTPGDVNHILSSSPGAHNSRPSSSNHSRSGSFNASQLPTAAQLQQHHLELSDPLSPFTTALITQLTNKEVARQRQLRQQQQLHSRSTSGGDELDFLNNNNNHFSFNSNGLINLGLGSDRRSSNTLNLYDPSVEDSYAPINPTSAASVSTPQHIISAISQQNSELDAILSSSPISSSAFSNPSSHPGTPFLASSHNSPLLSFTEGGIPELDIAMDFESHMNLASSTSANNIPTFSTNPTSPPLTLSIPTSSPEIQLTSPSPLTAKPKEEEIEGFPPGMRGDPIRGQRRPKGRATLEMEKMLAGLVPDPQAFPQSERDSSSPGPTFFSAGSPSGVAHSSTDSRNPFSPENFLEEPPKRQRSKSETALPMPRPEMWYSNPEMGIPIAPNNATLMASYGFDATNSVLGVNEIMVNPRDLLGYTGFDPNAPLPLNLQVDQLAARNHFLNVGGGMDPGLDRPEDIDSWVPTALQRRKSNPTTSRRASPYDTFVPASTSEADEFAPSGGSTSIRRSRSTGHADAAGRRHGRSRSDMGSNALPYPLIGTPTTAGGFLAPPGMKRGIDLGMTPGFSGVGGEMGFSTGFGGLPLYGVGLEANLHANGSPHSSPTSIASSGHSPPFGHGQMRPGTSSSRGSSPGSVASGLLRTGDGFVDPISKTTAATKKAAMDRRKPGTTARFKCEYCGETFTRHYNLKGHIRAHKNERPFVCEFPGCEKAFARAHDRKRHQLLHTGEKKYKCDVCQTAFVRLDALQRHHKSENGQQCVQILQSRGWSMNPDGTMSNSVVEIAQVPQLPTIPLPQSSQASGSRSVLV